MFNKYVTVPANIFVLENELSNKIQEEINF